jgi:ubiquinone/menaquinone biosynthesis C-methylase UbiE
MSWLVATLYDSIMGPPERACVAAWRAELLSPLTGDVLEIGAGTGYNLPHYPPSIARLTLAEPDRAMRAKLDAASRGLARAGASIVDASAQSLPFPDASFDAVVGTLVLCTIPDPRAALAEVRRVLRKGGRYVFLEHGAAEEGSARLRMQRWLEPAWRLAADGCHLTRRAGDLITQAGLGIAEARSESMRKALPFLRPTVRGFALKD